MNFAVLCKHTFEKRFLTRREFVVNFVCVVTEKNETLIKVSHFFQFPSPETLAAASIFLFYASLFACVSFFPSRSDPSNPRRAACPRSGDALTLPLSVGPLKDAC